MTLEVRIITDVFAVTKQISEDKIYYSLTIGTDNFALPFQGTYPPKIVFIDSTTYEILEKAIRVAVTYRVAQKTNAPYWEWQQIAVESWQ